MFRLSLIHKQPKHVPRSGSYGEELVKPLVTEIQQTPAAAPKILDEEGVRIPESLTQSYSYSHPRGPG